MLALRPDPCAREGLAPSRSLATDMGFGSPIDGAHPFALAFLRCGSSGPLNKARIRRERARRLNQAAPPKRTMGAADRGRRSPAEAGAARGQRGLCNGLPRGIVSRVVPTEPDGHTHSPCGTSTGTALRSLSAKAPQSGRPSLSETPPMRYEDSPLDVDNLFAHFQLTIVMVQAGGGKGRPCSSRAVIILHHSRRCRL